MRVFFSLWRQLSVLVMQGYNMCRWCYFSSHFTLGLKGSAAFVTVARVVWHTFKWPPGLSLGVLTLCFTSFSCSNSLCFSLRTLHLLNFAFHVLTSGGPSLSPSRFLPPAYFLPTPLPHCAPLPLFILSSPRPILPGDTHGLSGS